MNKKIATFLFAVGIGVASAPAFASCYYYCSLEWKACVASGAPMADCDADLQACHTECNGGNP